MTDGDTHKVALSKEPECGAWIVQKGERKTAYVGHSMNDVLTKQAGSPPAKAGG